MIYEKYRQHQERFAAKTRFVTGAVDGLAGAEMPPPARLLSALWEMPLRADPVVVYGSLATLAISVVWGLWFILQPWNSLAIGQSFLHRANLPFHEFGHVLFRPFGQWFMFLGGSLFQCLLPLLLAGYFVFRQRQPFSASVCLWWCGQNFIDLAPYIGDARLMALPLTGEWSDEIAAVREFRHDWHNILAPLGWLPYDHALARLSKTVGTVLMVLAWAWGGLLVAKQWRRL
ncbi:MAG: hypothetical protein P4L83_23940 [Nevskia sp.]|nr:hypothetical protein [Nevskia sp.]